MSNKKQKVETSTDAAIVGNTVLPAIPKDQTLIE